MVPGHHQRSNNRQYGFPATCRIRPPDNVTMYWSGVGNDFFIRHMEFNSWFNVMTINVIPSDRLKIVSGFIVMLSSCLMVESCPTPLEDLAR